MRIDLDGTVEDAVAKTRKHIDDVLNEYVIPHRLTQVSRSRNGSRKVQKGEGWYDWGVSF